MTRLQDTLLEPAVPHRQVVLTIPKRLRAWCLHHRSLLGDLSRVAAHTVTTAVRTLTGEPDLAVGFVACLQTHGSLANWHPHLHLLVTDGGFRLDGTFIPWPAHDTEALTEAFRRTVLRLFVRRGFSEEHEAQAMLRGARKWPPGPRGHRPPLRMPAYVVEKRQIPRIGRDEAGRTAHIIERAVGDSQDRAGSPCRASEANHPDRVKRS